MKKLLLAVTLIASVLAVKLLAQTYSIGSALPGTCVAGSNFYLTSAPYGYYICTATNTWTIVGGATAANGLTKKTASVMFSNPNATVSAGSEVFGFSAPNAVANNSEIYDSVNASTKFLAAASNNSTSNIGFNAWNDMRSLPTCVWEITTGSSIAVLRMWFGLSNSISLNLNSPTTSNIKLVGFRFSTNSSDTNWMASTELGDGTNATHTSTGVAVATATHYLLKFVTNSTSSIDFYVNNGTATNITTNIPTTTAMFPVAYIVTNENVGKFFNISRIYCESN